MIDSAFNNAIIRILPRDAILTDAADCLPYGYDNSRRQTTPAMVLFPSTEQQVADIVCLCNQYSYPITARGRGTGTTGASVPTQDSLVLSFEQMNKIIKLDVDNRVMVVQPGVTNQQVQDAAAAAGFFWAPDPTSAAFCTVGGNLAYNSAGPRAVKYGTCRENTLGLRAVTGDGRILNCGVYTTKGVVGYDLTRLIIGSEGTLAIITEATLKLLPRPETRRTLKVTYRTIESAAKAVSAIMAQPITPCSLEFMDANALNMVRDYSSADLPQDAGAMLMIEVDGSQDHIEHSVQAIEKACFNDGHLNTQSASTEQEINALWQTRKALSPSLRKIAPRKINEDVVVPVSRLPELVNGLDTLSQHYQIPIVNFGHAGNGNIHVNLLVDTHNQQQMDNATPCLDAVFDLVISLNGTLSGEHGVGTEKKEFINKELSIDEIDLMHQIKAIFDPKLLLNPGKTIPDRKTS
ncbi:MAG: FAD-binding protein [Gammaproteobacteria bacterium]|nr:FAD-binding protein [Gammaproteobacteria bacterium]